MRSKSVSVSTERLHLGCGKKFIPGWFHVDILPFDHIDHQGPVDDLGFIEDNSVKLIYACHLLEHFGRNEFHKPLKEWLRVLAPGGVLRLAVPDFGAVVKLYAAGKIGNLTEVMGLVMGGQRDQYDYHKVIFDEKFLGDALRGVGFKTVRRWDWRKTDHAGIDDYSQAYLPHMDKDNGTLVSLNLEAVK
jgi:predicted SAM-dependent methyltransferase